MATRETRARQETQLDLCEVHSHRAGAWHSSEGAGVLGVSELPVFKGWCRSIPQGARGYMKRFAVKIYNAFTVAVIVLSLVSFTISGLEEAYTQDKMERQEKLIDKLLAKSLEDLTRLDYRKFSA